MCFTDSWRKPPYSSPSNWWLLPSNLFCFLVILSHHHRQHTLNSHDYSHGIADFQEAFVKTDMQCHFHCHFSAYLVIILVIGFWIWTICQPRCVAVLVTSWHGISWHSTNRETDKQSHFHWACYMLRANSVNRQKLSDWIPAHTDNWALKSSKQSVDSFHFHFHWDCR